MLRPWLQNNNARLSNPFLDDRECFLRRQWVGPDPGVRSDTNKRPDGYPGQRNRFTTLQQFLEPPRGHRLLGRIRVIGV